MIEITWQIMKKFLWVVTNTVDYLLYEFSISVRNEIFMFSE